MRTLYIACLALLLSACGPSAEEIAAPTETAASAATQAIVETATQAQRNQLNEQATATQVMVATEDAAATATADLLGTRAAFRQATLDAVATETTIEETFEAAAAAFRADPTQEAFDALLNAADAYEPRRNPRDEGSIPHSPENPINIICNGAGGDDVLISVTASPSFTFFESTWLLGFTFRDLGDNAFLLDVTSNNQWNFFLTDEEGNSLELLQDGTLEPGLISADRPTTLTLVAIEEDGFFALNGQYIDRLDLSLYPDKTGEVCLIAGAATPDEGDRTRFSEFNVWLIRGQD